MSEEKKDNETKSTEEDEYGGIKNIAFTFFLMYLIHKFFDWALYSDE